MFSMSKKQKEGAAVNALRQMAGGGGGGDENRVITSKCCQALWAMVRSSDF